MFTIKYRWWFRVGPWRRARNICASGELRIVENIYTQVVCLRGERARKRMDGRFCLVLYRREGWSGEEVCG